MDIDSMEQCFVRSEDLSPLRRRFKVIEFPGGEQHAKFRAAWYNNPPDETTTTCETAESSSVDDDLVFPDLDIDALFRQS